MSDTLIKQLLAAPSAFNHSVSKLRLLETHISWVILTGHYAYKIKKPVDFEFLNYSTLEKRSFYCQEEIRLNKQLAPQLYLEVVTINGDPENPMINGTGPIIDYAVKMQEFPQTVLFTELLQANKLTVELIDQTAQLIAEFHQTTPKAPTDSNFGTPEHVHAPVVQNFEQMLSLVSNATDREQLLRLRAWSENQYKLHYHLLQKRKAEGFIRECHGDLHLRNIILYNNKPELFDRIEFNLDFLWTDVIADIAFLAMDLLDNKQDKLANRLLNQYFKQTGDYEGLALLPYYQAYRAIVRAKIILFRLTQLQKDDTEYHAIYQQYHNFIQLAESYAQKKSPVLLITHGFAGSGKSTVARTLADNLAAIHLNSDIERKRLFGLATNTNSQSAINHGIYTNEATEKTYNHLAYCAQIILHADFSVIVDATFLKHTHRKQFQQLAQAVNAPFVILHCQAPRELILQWITERQQNNQDVSEADNEIFMMQEKSIEALHEDEIKDAIIVETNKII
jgi:hypothetical protein